ncbi:MAG: hypothetical protein QOD06_7 [Candidatus Binatota bacterium]|jgi:ketosteroid isomerase-like protein|nr:hypothetical protein [Candidatus Binatota bacterium]
MTEDIVAIEQLLNRYCHTVDRGTADEVAALFHENASLVPVYSGGDTCHGREAIREWYAKYNRDFRSKLEHLRHLVASPLIDVTGGEARGELYLIADAITKATGKPFQAAGYYADRYVKEGGRWYFQRREIHVNYTADLTKLERLPS